MLSALKLIPIVFVALFPVVNPIGTALVIFGMTGDVDSQHWRQVSKKIALYTFLILTFFFLFGSYILLMFGITIPVVQLSGGLVVAAIGWNTLNQQDDKPPEANSAAQNTAQSHRSIDSKVLYPYTFPITVGPGCLAVVLTFSAHLNRTVRLEVPVEKAAVVFSIFLMSLVTYFCYAHLKSIVARLSSEGAMALSRIMAFFVLCIGVDIAWTGYQALLALVPK
jgi:multiple antibiotic resistance protein